MAGCVELCGIGRRVATKTATAFSLDHEGVCLANRAIREMRPLILEAMARYGWQGRKERMKIMQNNSSGREEDSVDPKKCPTHRLVGKQAFSIEEARFLLDKAAPYLCEVCRQSFQRLVLADGIIREDSEVNERSDPQFPAGSQLWGAFR